MKKSSTSQMEIARRQVEQRVDAAVREEDCDDARRLVLCLTPSELEGLLEECDRRSEAHDELWTLPCDYDSSIVPGPESIQ